MQKRPGSPVTIDDHWLMTRLADVSMTDPRWTNAMGKGNRQTNKVKNERQKTIPYMNTIITIISETWKYWLWGRGWFFSELGAVGATLSVTIRRITEHRELADWCCQRDTNEKWEQCESLPANCYDTFFLHIILLINTYIWLLNKTFCIQNNKYSNILRSIYRFSLCHD